MTGYPETKFCTKDTHIREHFRRSIQKSAISKKQNTDRRFLKELMASYEQKKELKQYD